MGAEWEEQPTKSRGRAGGRKGRARGPGKGGSARAECGSAWPRTRPGPAACGLRSVLRPSSGLGACGADRREASPSAWVLQPGLPAGRGVLSRSPPTPSLRAVRLGKARPRCGRGLRRPGPEPSGQAAAWVQPRNARRLLGWACRAGLLQGRPQAADREGKCSRSLCQDSMRTLRGPLQPAQFTTGVHRVPEAGTGHSSLFRRGKEEEKGDGAAAPQCACARLQFFFF